MEAGNKLDVYEDPDDSIEIDVQKKLIYDLKVSCTMAMLMCLTKEERIIFIIGSEIQY